MSSLPDKNSTNVSHFVPLQKSTSRTRLNLLNPMNLLARRRSAQATERLSIPTGKATSGVQRQTVAYEGIRGTKVHDFSAPRPRPQAQTVVKSPSRLQIPKNNKDGEAQSATTASAHTPVFKEDFDDGQSQFPAAGPHVRKPSNWSDLGVPMPAYAKNKELPPKPERSPEPETGTFEKPAPIPAKQPPPTPPRDKVAKRPELEERTLSYDAEAKEEVNSIPIGSLEIGSKKTPLVGVAAQDGRPRNSSDASMRSIKFSSMKHMKSNSSRFSFDMIGAATQEKLLEDRHREKAAENMGGMKQNDAYDEVDEDNFDYDDMMDDGLEERIPGVNADLDEEDEDAYDNEEPIPGVNADLDDEDEDHYTAKKPGGYINPEDSDDEDTYHESPQPQNLNGFTFHPMNTSTVTSPISPQGPPQPTPRDSPGDIIGAALTISSVLPPPNPLQSPETPEKDAEECSEAVRMSLDQDLEEQESTLQPQPTIKPQFPPISHAEFNIPQQKRYGDADDDMYFDDGTFGFDDDEKPIPMAGGGDFDESVFDSNDTDEYGRPIRNFDSSIPTTNYSPPGLTSDEASRRESAEDQLKKANKEMEAFAEGMSAFGLAGNLQPQSSVIGGPPLQPTISLTQDTLNAHLQALAAHTHAALSSGRFRRSSDDSPVGGPGGMAPYHFNTDNHLPDDFEDAIEDDFDYNDEFDEDDLIASANAEALAHDSGFYAQEFGFYSQPAPASGDEAVYANGGYFGPSGAGAIMINRSKSGRVLEPNLTPITERSEYSNRNSIMSLPQVGQSQYGGSMVGSPGLGPNMGLAQIAGMLREEDGEDMSIGALMKLRNKKWGGSQTSLSLGGQTPNDNRLSTGSPLLTPGQGGGGFGIGPAREDGASSPQWQHTPWQQQQTLSSSPELTKVEMQQQAYGLLNSRQPPHNRKNSAFSLHSETDHTDGILPIAAASSPTLTFSPPPPDRPQVQTNHSSNSIHSDNYFSQPVRPSAGQMQHSSKTITQSQQTSALPTPHTLPSPNDLKSDIPPPPNSMRRSLELRPTSSDRNFSSAVGLVNPSVQQFDAEVGFFSHKGKDRHGEINPEFRKHRHTGSTESVSYMKEKDLESPNGERWVLERRRTAESGEWEVEREVVRGGRI